MDIPPITVPPCAPLHPLDAPSNEIIYTLFLFTKSDFKTIMFPVTAFAMSLAENTSWNRLPAVAMWVWFGLLEFNTSNQTFGTSPDEDALNKPWRPIPAKRITLEAAKTLRLAMVPFNIFIASVFSTLPATIGFEAFTALHNDIGGSHHWLTKNGCTSALYGFVEFGATLVADDRGSLSQNQLCAILTSVLIVFTTIQAQDFCDVEGDIDSNRSTFPIVWPEVSRLSMLFLPVFWSLLISIFSNAHIAILASLLSSAIWISCRFYFMRSVPADKESYLYYNIWLCLAHLSLGFVNVDAGLAKLPTSIAHFAL
ncbi:hypothetical protein CYLTODRAFT_436349 [Cylindrobasidium torrendii FP15055 ss-10]|uniref:UbiA prenyltransferase n=1 Tax=Cylindrobasidium torrendii FP15055 ss-10 TaxID=1314674 RepID=A0A0D7BES1_9AGAR|nr:hypothetical protein CYLTODRAFT_436349 [Cylindrobasidium torrendii FP15055 ss-10]